MISKEKIFEGLRFGVNTSVGIGAAMIVKQVLVNNTPEADTKFRRLCLKLGAMAVVGLVVKRATDYSDNAVDSIEEGFNNFKKGYDEVMAEAEKVKREETYETVRKAMDYDEKTFAEMMKEAEESLKKENAMKKARSDIKDRRAELDKPLHEEVKDERQKED